MLKQYEVQKDVVVTFDLNGVTFEQAITDIDDALLHYNTTGRQVYPTRWDNAWGQMVVSPAIKRDGKDYYTVNCVKVA